MEKELAIVIPTYNEKQNIRKLLVSLTEKFPQCRIFVVDDDSPDGTAEAVREAAEKNKNVKLLLRHGKSSMSSAYIDAFARLLTNDEIKYILTMDADLSHDPNDLPRLFTAAEEGNDVVVGSRYVKGGRIVNWALWRQIISKYGAVYTRVITGVPVKDITAGLVLYTRNALAQILPHISKREPYAYQTEMKYEAKKAGLRLKEVPITFRERSSGKSKLKKLAILEALFFPWYLRFLK